MDQTAITIKPDMNAPPTVQKERIVILDNLREIAIRGILLMNIPGSGLPQVSTSDPGVLSETCTKYYTLYYWKLQPIKKTKVENLIPEELIVA